jgi:hypothetical protein
MERGSMENLKFDKRLRKRRDWISSSDADSYEAALPDVSDNRWVEDQNEPSSPTPPAAVSDSAPVASPALTSSPAPLGAPATEETASAPANPSGLPGDGPPRPDES